MVSTKTTRKGRPGRKAGAPTSTSSQQSASPKGPSRPVKPLPPPPPLTAKPNFSQKAKYVSKINQNSEAIKSSLIKTKAAAKKPAARSTKSSSTGELHTRSSSRADTTHHGHSHKHDQVVSSSSHQSDEHSTSCCCCCSTCPPKSDSNCSANSDSSVIGEPINLGRNGVRQILQSVQHATVEVKDLIYNECDLIFECKVCRNLFRSLANFLNHKRDFCLEHVCEQMVLFDPLTIKYQDADDVHEEETSNQAANKTSKPAAAVSPANPVLQEVTPDQNQIRVIETTFGNSKTKSLEQCLKKLAASAAKSRPQDFAVNLKPIASNPNAVYQEQFKPGDDDGHDDDQEAQEEESMDIEDEPTSNECDLNSFASSSPDTEDRHPRIKVTVKVPHSTNLSGFSSSILERRLSKTLDTSADSVASSSQGASLLAGSQTGSTDPVICQRCGSSFISKKTLRVHLKTIHAQQRLIYPCPFCCLTFKQICNATRHMISVHKKGKNDVKRLREVVKMRAKPSTDLDVNDDDEEESNDEEGEGDNDDSIEEDQVDCNSNTIKAEDEEPEASRSHDDSVEEVPISDVHDAKEEVSGDVVDAPMDVEQSQPLALYTELVIKTRSQLNAEKNESMSPTERNVIANPVEEAPILDIEGSVNVQAEQGGEGPPLLSPQENQQLSPDGHVCRGCNKFFARLISRIGHERTCKEARALNNKIKIKKASPIKRSPVKRAIKKSPIKSPVKRMLLETTESVDQDAAMTNSSETWKDFGWLDEETRDQLDTITCVLNLKCLSCLEREFTSQAQLVQHSVMHFDKEVWKCRGCPFLTVSELDVYNHLGDIHGVKSPIRANLMLNLSKPLSNTVKVNPVPIEIEEELQKPVIKIKELTLDSVPPAASSETSNLVNDCVSISSGDLDESSRCSSNNEDSGEESDGDSQLVNCSPPSSQLTPPNTSSPDQLTCETVNPVPSCSSGPIKLLIQRQPTMGTVNSHKKPKPCYAVTTINDHS